MTGRHSFKDHFSATAAAYAAYRPIYPTALADFLAEIAPRSHLAWDAGCGSGQLSVLLADRFARVMATDASAEQIAHATPRPHVAYVVARAEACALAVGTVDVAVAAQAAHWLDLPAYYAEVRRVGRPGGVVALVTYGLVRVDHVVDPVIDHFYSQVLGSYWPPERRSARPASRCGPAGRVRIWWATWRPGRQSGRSSGRWGRGRSRRSGVSSLTPGAPTQHPDRCAGHCRSGSAGCEGVIRAGPTACSEPTLAL